jgi:transposase-like protein
METAMKPVRNGRGRRWSSGQKLTVLQEWQTGVPLEELCRKYAVNAAQMYRWKRSLDQGLKESGEMIPTRVWCWTDKNGSRSWSGRWGGRPWRWTC